jgi:hypothetical protein
MAQAPTQDFIVNSGLTVLGTSVVTSATGNTGTLQVDGGAAVAKNLIVGTDAEIYGDLTVYGSIPYLTITTGTFTDLTVTSLSTLNALTSGITTASQLDVASRLLVGGLSQFNNATLASQTNSTSSTTGALQIAGGVGIQKDLWVGGRAWVGGFEVLTTATALASTLQQVTEQGSSTTVAISILNATPTTSTNSGALTVAGGVGIGENLYIGTTATLGALSTNYIQISGSETEPRYDATKNGLSLVSDSIGLTFSTVNFGAVNYVLRANSGNYTQFSLEPLNSNPSSYITIRADVVVDYNSTTSVAGPKLIVNGGSENASLFIAPKGDGNVVIDSTKPVSNTGTAALIVKGGQFIYGGLIVNAVTATNLVVTSTLSNTTTVAGNALQVQGGVGIDGSLFVHGPAYFSNNVVFSGTSTSILSTTTVYTDNYIELHFPAGSGDDGEWFVDDGKDIGHIYHHYKDSTGDEHGALIWHNASDELRWYMGGVDLVPSTQQWDVSTATFGVFRTGSILLEKTTAATSTSTGTLVVAGGVGIGGALYIQRTSYVNNAEILTTATIGSYGVSSIAAGTDTVVSSSTGSITIWNNSTLQSITNRGSNTTNQIVITNRTTATATNTGALQVVGGVGIGGDLYVGGVGILNGLQASNIVASGTLGVTGTSTLGVVNATSATFSGTLGVTGTSVFAGLTSVTNNTASTSTTTGALQVVGGVGIGGALYIQRTSYVNNAEILTTATIGSYGVSSIAAGTDTVVSTSTGAVLIWNTSTLQSITNRGAVTTNAVSITNTTSSISTTTGALQVVGGIGVGDSVYVKNRVGFVNTSNVSAVYQVYNAVTNSLDTVFA